MSQFPTVQVSGSPRERGRQYGESARDRVRRSIDAYRDVFAHYAGWDWPKVTAEALRYVEPVGAFDERYVEEMHGLAEGAGVPFDDVIAINTRSEIMFAAKARAADGQARLPAECTSFAVLPEASANGHTLIGQNWDWLPYSFDTCMVVESQQDDGPDYVTVVEAGLLAKTGMNSSGIGLCANALVSDADRGVPGVPFHVLLRGILDAENLSDALSVLQRGLRSSSANYLIGHRDGIAVDVEGAPGDFSRLFLLFPDAGVLTHTNHFVSPSFDGRDVSLWVMPDSAFRLERMRSQVAAAGNTLSVETFQEALADHANHPSGVCCHPDPRDAPPDQGATVASVIMDLDARRMWLADGQPCSHPYRTIDYGDFLSKPSRVAPADGPAARRVPA
jgi:isopenicillin-N N-acyltransferase-like protein